jgi:hypothetical protein
MMRKSRDSGEQLQETAHVERGVEESLCITLSTFGHDGVGKAGAAKRRGVVSNEAREPGQAARFSSAVVYSIRTVLSVKQFIAMLLLYCY